MTTQQLLPLLLALFLVSGCSSSLPEPAPDYPAKTGQPAHTKPYKVYGKTYRPLATARGFSQKGIASWYGKQFHGRKTSSGEVYDMHAMTAAHKTLPLGTWVRVDNLDNGRTITVRVNDRGPFVDGRIIDLSYAGAREIGLVGPGTARVRVLALGKAPDGSSKARPPSTFTPVDYWSGNFTVQVGAFMERTNAYRLRDKLSQYYDNAHIQIYTDDRGTFWRVRVGRFTELEQAEAFSLEMIREGAGSAFVVAE